MPQIQNAVAHPATDPQWASQEKQDKPLRAAFSEAMLLFQVRN